MKLKKLGGGGGGSGLDYVILLSEGGWVLITVDYGGGKNCQKIDYVICERPLCKIPLLARGLGQARR